jgi:hypothetical protein
MVPMRRYTRRTVASKMYNKDFSKADARKVFDCSLKENQLEPIPVVNSLGNFLTMNVYDSFTPQTDTISNLFFIVQFTPYGRSFIHFNAATADNTVTNTTFRGFPQITSNIPVSVRPSRKSITVSSLMNDNNIAGSVSVLNISSFLAYDFLTVSFNFTPAFAASVDGLLNSSPETKVYNASTFKTPRTFSIFPASYVNYSQFHDFDNWDNLTDAQRKEGMQAFTELMPCTTLILKFSAVSVTQSYAVQMYEQIAARYQANTLLSSLHRPGKVTTAQVLQMITDRAHRSGTMTPTGIDAGTQSVSS